MLSWPSGYPDIDVRRRAMWVAPVVKTSVFLVWYWGVVTSLRGPLAHGFVGGTDVMLYGARLSRKPMIINGMERRMVTFGSGPGVDMAVLT